MFINVGSVIKLHEDYHPYGATKRGRIPAGGYCKLLRYNKNDCIIHRCSENGKLYSKSYPIAVDKYIFFSHIKE